jgi:hypothetical protein
MMIDKISTNVLSTYTVLARTRQRCHWSRAQAHDGEEPDCAVLRTAPHRHGFNSPHSAHCARVNILFPWTVRPATSTQVVLKIMGVLGLCSARTVDFEDACVRETWAALLPAALVAVLLVLALPLPAPLRPLWTYVAGPFRTYITLPEAEAYLAGASVASAAEVRHTTARRASGWRTAALCLFALVPALGWAGVASFNLALRSDEPIAWADVQPVVLAGVWVYAALRTVIAPTPTPAYGLFTLYALQFLGGIVVLGGMAYGARIGEGVYLPTGILVGHIADVIASVVLLLVSLSTPMAIPSVNVKEADVGKSVSPEDYTTLWGWLSFSWVTPLVDAGTSATLDEKDVWALSPTMQSKPIFSKFGSIQRKTLLRRLWAANSLDIIVDCGLSTSTSALLVTFRILTLLAQRS